MPKELTLDNLPKGVSSKLPKHAQKIYMEAHNNALKEYKNPEKRRDPNEDLEQVANKIAWSAVEKKYKKVGEHWVEKK